MKTELKAINSKLNNAEEQISDLKDRIMEITQSEQETGDFPGGAVDKTPRSRCRGPGFNPWSGN